MLACKPEDSVLSYYVDLQELVWLGGNTLYGVISLTLPCALYWGTFRNLVGVKWQVAVSFSASFTVYHAGALCCLLCFCISHRPSCPLVCLLLWICSESTWLIHLLSSSRYLSTWPGASLTSVTSSREENSRLPFTTLQNLVFSILFSTSGSLLSQTSLKASGNWGFLWLPQEIGDSYGCNMIFCCSPFMCFCWIFPGELCHLTPPAGTDSSLESWGRCAALLTVIICSWPTSLSLGSTFLNKETHCFLNSSFSYADWFYTNESGFYSSLFFVL